MGVDDILEGVDDAAHGVQHAHRSLHDVGDFLPAHIGAQLVFGDAQHIDIIRAKLVADTPFLDPERRPDCAGDDLDQRGLAAARLAGHAIDLVRHELKGDSVHGAHRPRDAVHLGSIVGNQLLHAQQCHRSRSHPAQARARVDVFIDAGEEQVQTKEQNDGADDGNGQPPPDAGHQGLVLIGPVDRRCRRWEATRWRAQGR